MKYIIFERFLIEGVDIYFKIIIVLFQCAENVILESENMIEFNNKLSEFINDEKNTKLLRKKIDRLYLNSHLIQFLRENLISKEFEKFNTNKKSKKKNKKCEKQIPLCFKDKEKDEKHFILKTDFFLKNLKNLYFNPFKKKINMGIDMQKKIFRILSNKNLEKPNKKTMALSKNVSLTNLNLGKFNLKSKYKKKKNLSRPNTDASKKSRINLKFDNIKINPDFFKFLENKEIEDNLILARNEHRCDFINQWEERRKKFKKLKKKFFYKENESIYKFHFDENKRNNFTKKFNESEYVISFYEEEDKNDMLTVQNSFIGGPNKKKTNSEDKKKKN